MAARAGAQKLSLLKRGWHEVPDVVASVAIATAGLVLAGVAIYRDQVNFDRNYQHRAQYTDNLKYFLVPSTNIEDENFRMIELNKSLQFRIIRNSTAHNLGLAEKKFSLWTKLILQDLNRVYNLNKWSELRGDRVERFS